MKIIANCDVIYDIIINNYYNEGKTHFHFRQ